MKCSTPRHFKIKNADYNYRSMKQVHQLPLSIKLPKLNGQFAIRGVAPVNCMPLFRKKQTMNKQNAKIVAKILLW